LNGKRILIRTVICIVLAAVAAAGFFYLHSKRNAAKAEGGKRKILCTTYPVFLFVREVAAGGPIRPELLLPPEAGCPHDYSLTPGDLMKISGEGTLLIRNGLGLDDSLWKTARAANPGLKSVSLADGIAGVIHSDDDDDHDHEGKEKHEDHAAGNGEACKDPKCGDHHHHHRHGDHHHHHGDPVNGHLFASPDTAAEMVTNAVRALSEYDPENAALYEANGRKLRDELLSLAQEFRSAGLDGRRIAVQHDIYAYLARLCGMKMEVSLHAEESQSLSPALIARICKEIREEKVTVLYAEPQYSRETAELIAREAGIAYSVLDPCASGPSDPESGYYQKVMRKNLETLRGGRGK